MQGGIDILPPRAVHMDGPFYFYFCLKRDTGHTPSVYRDRPPFRAAHNGAHPLMTLHILTVGTYVSPSVPPQTFRAIVQNDEIFNID